MLFYTFNNHTIIRKTGLRDPVCMRSRLNGNRNPKNVQPALRSDRILLQNRLLNRLRPILSKHLNALLIWVQIECSGLTFFRF